MMLDLFSTFGFSHIKMEDAARPVVGDANSSQMLIDRNEHGPIFPWVNGPWSTIIHQGKFLARHMDDSKRIFHGQQLILV
jgi:hypothetical protein